MPGRTVIKFIANTIPIIIFFLDFIYGFFADIQKFQTFVHIINIYLNQTMSNLKTLENKMNKNET